MDTKGLLCLTCPSCGGHVEIQPAGEQVYCPYCGTRFLVPDLAQAKALTGLTEELQRQREETARQSERLALELQLRSKEQALLAVQQTYDKKSADTSKRLVGAMLGGVILVAMIWGLDQIMLGFALGFVLWLAMWLLEAYPWYRKRQMLQGEVRSLKRAISKLEAKA